MENTKRKRTSTTQEDVSHGFRLFEKLRKMETKEAETSYKDGACLGKECSERCDGTCSWKCLERTPCSIVFVCKQHNRIHRCGAECQERVLSHEDWSCRLTGEVVGRCMLHSAHF